jgi:hypothetical protein
MDRRCFEVILPLKSLCLARLFQVPSAIIRYILNRHGIEPRLFVATDRPVRIGDVLILPARAFQADASEGSQPDNACVWHGFHGSWRHRDPQEL